MPPNVAFTLIAIGTALNLAGLALACRALIIAWREYGDGPLLPWLWAGLSRAQSTVRAAAIRLGLVKPQSVGTTVLSVSGVASSVSSVTARVNSRVGFRDDMSDPERLGALQRAVDSLYDQFFDEIGYNNSRHSELQSRLSELAGRVDSEAQDRRDADAVLDGLARRVAAGDVRLQLASVILVAFGTILSVTPAAWAFLSP